MPKGQSESVNLRRTDNTMAKRKSIKGQTIVYKALHSKLSKSKKDSQHQNVILL